MSMDRGMSILSVADSRNSDSQKLLVEAEQMLQDHGSKALSDALSYPGPSPIEIPVPLLPYIASLLHTPSPQVSLLTPTKRLPTNISSLDIALNGGLLLGGGDIIEIQGPSGAGKSTFALQLLASCGRRGMRSVHLRTHGAFSLGRLREILGEGEEAEEALKMIVVERQGEVEGLLNWTQWRLPYILREFGAKVVVIDDVAAVFRPAFVHEESMQRAQTLELFGERIRNAVCRYGAICICVNQIAARPGFKNHVAALGSAWAKCVNMKIEMGRLGNGKQRWIKILQSSYVKCGTQITVAITTQGIVDEDDSNEATNEGG